MSSSIIALVASIVFVFIEMIYVGTWWDKHEKETGKYAVILFIITMVVFAFGFCGGDWLPFLYCGVFVRIWVDTLYSWVTDRKWWYIRKVSLTQPILSRMHPALVYLLRLILTAYLFITFPY